MKRYLTESEYLCWQKYVQAVSLFCSRMITHNNVTIADKLIHEFCLQFEELYGSEKCTQNLQCPWTVSKELISLTWDLWMWCLERIIHIQAQYLPGVMNQTAIRESRSMRDRSDWSLDRSLNLPRNKQTLWATGCGPICVQTHQCRRYFSWRPDPFAEATDAFLQDWMTINGFANPPWNLIPRVLMKTQKQGVDVILVTPVWKTQPRYPLLLSLVADWRLLPKQTPNIESVPIMPQLAVWSISGRALAVKAFQDKLQSLSSTHGDQKLADHKTHYLGDGIAGVLCGVQIPFQDL